LGAGNGKQYCASDEKRTGGKLSFHGV
jgi:hypothetical protein